SKVRLRLSTQIDVMRHDPFPTGGRTPRGADERNRRRHAAAFRPYNGLALSCAAPIRRERARADFSFQNADDLRAACGVSSSTVLGRRTPNLRAGALAHE